MDIPTQRKTAKAEAILAAGGIQHLDQAAVWAVTGKTDLYLVIESEDAWYCTCPSKDPDCSHVLAVRQMIAEGTDDPFAGLGRHDWTA